MDSYKQMMTSIRRSTEIEGLYCAGSMKAPGNRTRHLPELRTRIRVSASP